MNYKLFALLSALVCVGLSSGPVTLHALPAHFELLVLEPPSGASFPESYLWDLNEDGVACGTVTLSPSYAGVVSDLKGTQYLFDASWLRGINDAGQVVGHNLVIDYETGIQTVIPQVSAAYSNMLAQAINNNNVVVGIAAYRISGEDQQLAFTWDPEHGTRVVSVPAARELLRINDSNVAVGNVRPSSGSSEAFIYDVNSGNWIDLHALLSPPGGPGYSIAVDISQSGIVAGEGWNGALYQGFTWEPAQGFRFLPGLGGGQTDRVHPAGVDAAGSVVGSALTATQGWRAFVWNPVVGMQDLNDLVIDGGGFVLRRATRINDAGVIIGDGQWGAAGTARAFMLIPSATLGVEPGIRAESMRARPNPFRGVVSLDIQLREPGPVRLAVYDVAGRRVAELFNAEWFGGSRTVTWSGHRDSGEASPAGMYFAILEVNGRRLVHRLVMTR